MHYDALRCIRGSWQRLSPSLPDINARELKILTYNVWFESHEFQERTRALLDLIDRVDADFVCLQEVTEPFAQALCSDARLVAKYYFPNKVVSSYTVFIIARHPVVFGEVPLTTRMGRSLATAHFKLNGEPAVISTVHLESLDNERLRKGQLDAIFPYISISPFALLCGDFNFHHTWTTEQANLQSDYVDAWGSLHDISAEPGFTMPATRSFPAWRPDRIIIKSSSWRVSNVEIIGKEPLAKYRHFADPTPLADSIVKTPSDHYGVVATLSL